MVLGALTILTVMLTEFQDETSAELGSALSERDALKAEYAAKSAVNLARLLIAAEPTIRNSPTIGPLIAMMFRGQTPQIPVWAFADSVLGAFNDSEKTAAFGTFAGLKMEEGKSLGMQGAGFEIVVVDEDSKINVNLGARGQFTSLRLSGELAGLIGSPQYDALFEHRDRDGQFSDRLTICSAIIDWADPDEQSFPCEANAGSAAQQSAAEDSYYQLLKKPYARKNAPFDSLEELRLVRGIGDDFWATFVEPEPDDPRRRVMTVWGQGQINVNTADALTIYGLVCSHEVAPDHAICKDPNEMLRFLALLNLLRDVGMGIPVFGSPKAFVNALKQTRGSPFTEMAKQLNIAPMQIVAENLLIAAITVESKVFSIYATGYVKSGKRETRVRIHSVVDFRGAPTVGGGGAHAARHAPRLALSYAGTNHTASHDGRCSRHPGRARAECGRQRGLF